MASVTLRAGKGRQDPSVKDAGMTLCYCGNIALTYHAQHDNAPFLSTLSSTHAYAVTLMHNHLLSVSWQAPHTASL